MRDEMTERIITEAEYIVETGATVRKAAKNFHFSKSTIHKDVTERLMETDAALYKKVKKILDKNLSERHIRGGNATREKYLRLKKGTAL